MGKANSTTNQDVKRDIYNFLSYIFTTKLISLEQQPI